MRNILKTIVYIFFPPYLIIYFLKYFDIISIKTEISIFLALFINIINLFLVLLFFNFSKNKSNNAFMILNIGGMGIRVVLTIITFTLSLIFLEIDKYAFIFVFLIFYSINIIFEIKHFNSKSENKVL